MASFELIIVSCSSGTRIPQLGCRKREAQSFRNEVDRFLPFSVHRSALLEEMLKPHRDGVRERQIILELRKSDAFAAPRLRLVPGAFGFNCGIRVERSAAMERLELLELLLPLLPLRWTMLTVNSLYSYERRSR